MIEEIVKLRKKGFSFRKVAEELNTTVGKVQYEWSKWKKIQNLQQSQPQHVKNRTYPILKFPERLGLEAKLVPPSKIYLHWNNCEEEEKLIESYFNLKYGDLDEAIRIYDVTEIQFNGCNENGIHEIIIPPHREFWTIKGLHPDRCYLAEFGFKLDENHFFALKRSNTIYIPKIDSSNETALKDGVVEFIKSRNQMKAWEENVSTYSLYEEGYKGLSIKAPRFDEEDKLETDQERYLLPTKKFFDGLRKERSNTEVQKKGLSILLLTWEFPPNIVGGLSRHTFGLSVGLSELECQLYVVTARKEGLPAYEIFNGIHIYRVAPLHENGSDFLMWIGGLNIAMTKMALQLANEHRFDIIHAHDWLVGSAAATLKEALSVPLLTTIHATEYGRNNGIYTELQRFIHEKESQLIKSSHHIIVCSSYMKDELSTVFRTLEDKISVIPNGISELSPTPFMTVEEFHFPNFHEKKMIFSIGRMVKEKGFETIIEAAILAKNLRLEIYFVVAGKGPLLESYRKTIKENQLEGYLFFLGFVQDEQREALFKQCDIAVFPSLYEPFGIVALEAMSHGKPTIVSYTGGLKGIILNKKTGLIFEPGNAHDLIEKIRYALNHPEEAREMGWNGKKMINSLYSWKRIAMDTRRLMDDIILLAKLDMEGIQHKK